MRGVRRVSPSSEEPSHMSMGGERYPKSGESPDVGACECMVATSDVECRSQRPPQPGLVCAIF